MNNLPKHRADTPRRHRSRTAAVIAAVVGVFAALGLGGSAGASPANTVIPDDDYWLHVSLTQSRTHPWFAYGQSVVVAQAGTRAAQKALLAHDPGASFTVFHVVTATVKTVRYTVSDVQTLPVSQVPAQVPGGVLLETPAPSGGVRWVLLEAS